MIRKLLFGNRSIALTKAGLDAGTERMRVVSENVANVMTPGYRAKRVRFEELIDEARKTICLDRTDPGHLAGAPCGPDAAPPPSVELSEDAVAEGTVNNVDVEHELVLMKQNEIHFQALSQLLARKYGGIRDAIR